MTLMAASVGRYARSDGLESDRLAMRQMIDSAAAWHDLHGQSDQAISYTQPVVLQADDLLRSGRRGSITVWRDPATGLPMIRARIVHPNGRILMRNLRLPDNPATSP